MGIPVGKLSLYIASALFHPDRTLPVVIDVGCNVPKVRDDDPFYMGLKEDRLKDEEYYPLIGEFMVAAKVYIYILKLIYIYLYSFSYTLATLYSFFFFLKH